MKVHYFFILFGFALLGGCQPKAFTTIAPETYQSLPNKEAGVLLDVRTAEEFTAGHVANAQNSDWRGGQFAQDLAGWDKEKTYYLYCATGNRSGQALQKMKEAGFKRVYNLGGYKQLKEAGIPTQEK